jgi:hypothetical protein
MRHLAENFRRTFKSPALVRLLWRAAYATTEHGFVEEVQKIEKSSPAVAKWIHDSEPAHWATAYFKGARFGHLTSNVAESINAWILEAKELPILDMFEKIRWQLMKWFSERREASSTMTGPLVPRVANLISANVRKARRYQVLKASHTEFECVSSNGTNITDVEKETCTCRAWQLLGYPCAHAAAVLLFMHRSPQNFAHACFSLESYQSMYAMVIHPVPDKTYWSSFVDMAIIPPKTLRPPG